MWGFVHLSSFAYIVDEIRDIPFAVYNFCVVKRIILMSYCNCQRNFVQ
jgi:hypothetical protein